MRISLVSVFLFLTLSAQTQDQDFESPCPRVFHYGITSVDMGMLHAHLTVPFPKSGSVIHTTLIMTVQGPYEGYQGELILTRNRSEVIADILNNRIDVLEFRVHLPRLEPVPILGVVLVNQVVICMGPMIVPYDQFTVVTSLTLNHFLHMGTNSSVTSKNKMVQNKTSPAQEKSRVTRLQDVVNMTAVQLIRDYLDEGTKDDFDSSDVTPQLDLRIDPKFQNLTFVSTERNCSSFSRGYYPWIVAVYIKSGLGVQYHCTSNLITSRHVILAGHCLQESRRSLIASDQLILFFGKTKLSSWEDHVQTREVSSVFIHPQFDHFSYTSDVAILKFSSPVKYSHRVSPICLWTPGDTEARVGMVVGWGMNPKTHNFVPDLLRPAIVQLIPWELCIQDRDLFYITSHTTLCAISVDGTGPCNGDSGAGMVLLDPQSNIWYLRALVSLAMVDQSTQRCDLNRSVVLTNVSKYQAWLQEVLVQE